MCCVVSLKYGGNLNNSWFNSYRYERLAGKYAYAHICVSDAMCKFLKEEWKLDGIMTVLHDKAPVHFQSLSTSQRSKVWKCSYLSHHK